MLPSTDSEDSVDEGRPAAMTVHCADDGDTDETPMYVAAKTGFIQGNTREAPS